MRVQLIDGPLGLPRARHKVREAVFQDESAIDIAKATVDELDSVTDTDPNPPVRLMDGVTEDGAFVPAKFSKIGGPSSPAGIIHLSRELVDKANEERGIWLDAIRFITAHEWGHAFVSFLNTLRMGVPPRALVADIATLEREGYIDYRDITGPNDERFTNASQVFDAIRGQGIEDRFPQDQIGHTLGDSIGEHITDLERDNVEDMTYNLAVEVGVDDPEDLTV